jgi:hypothetical protein
VAQAALELALQFAEVDLGIVRAQHGSEDPGVLALQFFLHELVCSIASSNLYLPYL